MVTVGDETALGVFLYTSAAFESTPQVLGNRWLHEEP
jgi:hypothetical protein